MSGPNCSARHVVGEPSLRIVDLHHENHLLADGKQFELLAVRSVTHCWPTAGGIPEAA